MSQPNDIKKAVRGKPILADQINRVITGVKNWLKTSFDPTWFNYIGSSEGGGKLTFKPGYIFARVIQNSQVSFGYAIDQGDSQVDVSTGYVNTFSESVAVAAQSVTVSGGTAANPHYIYVRFPPDQPSQAEIGTTPLASYPTSNASYIYVTLYAVSRVSGIINIEKIHHLGDIFAPIRLEGT